MKQLITCQQGSIFLLLREQAILISCITFDLQNEIKYFVYCHNATYYHKLSKKIVVIELLPRQSEYQFCFLVLSIEKNTTKKYHLPEHWQRRRVYLESSSPPCLLIYWSVTDDLDLWRIDLDPWMTQSYSL